MPQSGPDEDTWGGSLGLAPDAVASGLCKRGKADRTKRRAGNCGAAFSFYQQWMQLVVSKLTPATTSFMTSDPKYSLVDPRPVAAKAPYTFFLPSAVEIAAVTEGDLVKLNFDYPHETEKWSGERMWVEVSNASGNNLTGSLENEPDEPTSPLRLGQQIQFERHHILSIQWKNPANAPSPKEYREYWERCLVDQCVLDGVEPVEYIYREEPGMQSEGDRYPDSGWRIRGRLGDADDNKMETRAPAYVALGAVLNQDDSWVHLIDSIIGSRFRRDFATGRYSPEQ